MTLLDFFLSRNKNTAYIAKERLQLIVSERKKCQSLPDCFPQLKQEILSVICKYVHIDPNMIKIQLNHKNKNVSIIELNIILPE
ncbi:cell division topological specificity factor MinE [Buchnera aphidicola]|uniref:cell division topological specificity factor MinE n=1 Tax=Buchnera aphidicola TaxID=9 RepID=UPI003463A6FE